VILRGGRVALRPGVDADVGRLESVLNEPDVRHRWGHFDTAEIREQFVGSDVAFVIEVDREVIGAIQFHEEEDPMYRHAGIDIFLGGSQRGRGLGTEAIRVLARHLITERGHHRLSIDPAADNEVAIRAYERVGFRKVGVLRKYERGPDGTWHDGLLMDMLAEDFTDAGAPTSPPRSGGEPESRRDG
jgi:aminoglycoside 6'-N-acetyltransferase